MPVLIALADVGPAVQLEEQLVQAGTRATWDAAQVDGPHGASSPTVVLLDADRLGPRLASVADAWRDHPAMPGLVAIGGARSRDHAAQARVTLLAATASLDTITAAIREAAQLRLASRISWPVMCEALGLAALPDSPAAWPAALAAARSVELDVPRTALRWRADHYATPTARLDQLREERLLTVPELEAASLLDGTTTVRTVIETADLDATQAARLVWALGSLGALDFTPDIRDLATFPRRQLAELRAHLRGRARRLERSTYYDVLEITPLAEYPEIEAAYALVAERYGPDTLAAHDLADATSLVEPSWALVDKARSVLADDAQRGRYHDWLRQRLPELRTSWAIDPPAATAAIEAYARGQRALGEGDVHRAMSELATACRHHPGHPEYEAALAWARYRVQVASGRDRLEAAAAERRTVEQVLSGCRVWPRSLVALSLICAAAGDLDAARWHVHTALTTDPAEPAALQLAQRLGMRR